MLIFSPFRPTTCNVKCASTMSRCQRLWWRKRLTTSFTSAASIATNVGVVKAMLTSSHRVRLATKPLTTGSFHDALRYGDGSYASCLKDCASLDASSEIAALGTEVNSIFRVAAEDVAIKCTAQRGGDAVRKFLQICDGAIELSLEGLVNA